MRGFTSDVSPPVRPRGSNRLVRTAAATALAVLLLSAAGLIGTAPPAAASPPPPGTSTSAVTASGSTAASGTTAVVSTTAALSAAASLLTGTGLAPGSASARPAAVPTPSAVAPSDTGTPSGTPTPPPTPRPVSIDRLPDLVRSFPLAVSGTATPQDTVSVSAGSSPGAAESCTATADDDGDWRCSLASLPDGEGVPVRAESTRSGSDSTRVDVLHPPVIAGTGVVATSGSIRGTAYPGASVTVTAETGASCTFPADANGAWACVLTGSLPDGQHTVSATQTAPFSSQSSAVSGRVTIDVDRTAPAAPGITSPPSGASARAGETVAFGGTGESGAHVTLYATTSQGTTVVCTADVAAGAWSCQGALPAGAYTLSALQRDDAGNVSGGSNAVALSVAGATTPSKPSPTRTPSPTPTPAVPAPPAAGGGSGTGPLHPDTRGWIATPFSNASAPVVTAASLPGWMRSAGLAIAALLLLVLPARLLTAALARGRADRAERERRRGVSVFGRNRPRSDVSEASALFGAAARSERVSGSGRSGARADTTTTSSGAPQPRWLAPVVGAAAAVLVTLSTPLSDPGAYLRVLLAIGIAVTAVNAVWVLAGRGIAPHLGLPAPRIVVRPELLVVVAVAAFGSRLLGLSPALLFALVLGLSMAPHAGRARRGRIASVQISAVAALGVLAWLAVGLLATPTGAFSAFLVELVNAIALIGIGSAAVMLLPLGALAGRAVAQWSRWLWGGLSLVVYTVLFALLLPVASLVERGVGVVAIVGVAAGFAAASVAVWLWERYVAPALDRTVP